MIHNVTSWAERQAEAGDKPLMRAVRFSDALKHREFDSLGFVNLAGQTLGMPVDDMLIEDLRVDAPTSTPQWFNAVWDVLDESERKLLVWQVAGIANQGLGDPGEPAMFIAATEDCMTQALIFATAYQAAQMGMVPVGVALYSDGYAKTPERCHSIEDLTASIASSRGLGRQ